MSIPPPQKGLFPRPHTTPPPPYPTPWKFQLSFINFFHFFDLTEHPSPRKFQSPGWGEYGYFLELHNVYTIYKITNDKLIKCRFDLAFH